MSQLFQVNQMNVEELVEFAEKNPWKPQYPKPLVRRFLTELISSQDLVFDFHDRKGRVSAAVLLDKVNNPANDACLEVLGLRSDFEPAALLTKFIKLAKERTPKGRAGFQVGLPENTPISSKFLKEHGLTHYYDTFEMQQSKLQTAPRSSHDEIVDATSNEVDEVYKVLCESFAKNPDTSIPEISTWKLGFLKSPKSHFYLWRDAKKILGFSTLIEDEAGHETEIRTIGVLPEHRGKGIGRHLLNYCLNRTFDLGFKSCHLTVAVTNKKALDLYLRAGFEITEKFMCYRMELQK
ncbi:MAG: GNAT family N-acetyltransferase [Pseudobdellovibrionaceae bacterium]